MTKRLLFALCLFVSWGAHAANIDTRNAKFDICGSYSIMHINGVNTDRPSAEANLAEIRLRYGNAHADHLIHYALTYNNTITLVMDIKDAMYRTIAEFPGITFSQWVNAFYNGIFPSWFPQSLMATITTRLAFHFNIVNRPDTFYEQDVVFIAAEAQRLNLLNRGSKLLIVGHSEGTIIANTMFRRFTSALTVPPMQPQQIGLMSIAAFVPSIAGTGSQYVTNHNDRPVQMGRLAYTAIKIGTVTIPHTEDFYSPWRGHNLIGKYLFDLNSRKQITDKMKLVLDGLKTSSLHFKGPYWAPTDYYGHAVSYSKVYYNPPLVATPPVPSHYWWYLPEPSNAYTGGWSGYVYGSEAQAIATGIAIGKICYNYHITETLQRRALGDFSWVQIYGGCWGPLSEPYAGSWFPYSGDAPPVFRGKFVPYYPSGGSGSVEVTAGAMCKTT